MATNAGTGLSLRINDDGTDTDSTPFAITATGDVGIGTVTPAQTLDILGTTLLTNTSTALTGTAATFLASGNNAANTGNLIKATVSGTSAATVPIMATNAGTGLSLRINDDGTDTDSTPFVVDASGFTGVRDATPDYAFEVSGTSDSEIGMSDTALAHGVTFLVNTDTFGHFSELTSITGGLRIRGLVNSAAIEPITLSGIFGSTDPIDTVAAVRVVGAKRSSTTTVGLGALEKTFEVQGGSGTTKLFNVLDGGNIGIGDDSPDTQLEISHATVPVMTMSDPGLAHGMTTQLATDSFVSLSQLTDNDGGLKLIGASDAAGQNALKIIGAIGVTDTTDNIPALLLTGAKKSGTTIADVAA
ncbi:MAG: hypothetical protein ACREVA_13080, partial [Burkholderiales bacterium]